MPYSVAEAVKLGKLVLSAYDLYSSPTAFVAPAGYTLISKVYADDITDGTSAYQLFGFIATSGTDVYVALRGTQNVFEWLEDFDFVLVRFPYVDAGETEQGFNGFYSTLRTGPANTERRVIDALHDVVNSIGATSVSIAGHSLGGAMATLLAIDVADNQVFKTPTVYTFASPMVGNGDFATAYNGLVTDSWRIVNANDLVPKQPPTWFGYQHVATAVPIDSGTASKRSYSCLHSLDTYLHTLDATMPLSNSCIDPAI